VLKIMTISLAALCASSVAAQAALTIIVRDIDTGEGIAADIVLQTAPPSTVNTPFATTDDATGEASDPAVSCLARYVVVTPQEQDQYDPPAKKICSGQRVTVLVRNRNRVSQILSIAQNASQSRNYGLAIQAYSDLNALAPEPDTEQLIYENLAKKLAVPKEQALVHDPQQDKIVMSPALVAKLKKIQRENRLQATGQLDSRTVAVIAKGTFGDNISPHL
jgi:hypothetical protein